MYKLVTIKKNLGTVIYDCKILTKFFLLIVLIKLSSCGNTRPLQYVQGHFDTAQLSSYQVKEPVIQTGDLLNIIVYSDNPTATEIYNLPNTGGTGESGMSTIATGYLVDDQGNIQMQGIGRLHVAGLTKDQLADILRPKHSIVLQNPYYNIRFLNYKVTVIGEVNREGIYTIPNEKVNIFEVIGLAGGLSIYARRENVMIIREANGKREFGRLNLTDPQLFQSPYYFLQQNDLVVVEQLKSKATANDQLTARNITLVSTIISTIAIVYSIIRR
jgi:polysaccharide biosynthesis/export protein